MKRVLAYVVYGLCCLTIVGAMVAVVVALVYAALHGDKSAQAFLATCGFMAFVMGFIAAFAWAATELDI